GTILPNDDPNSASKCPQMYGPPRDCKGKDKAIDRSAQMYSAFGWRAKSPGHDELRCVLFLINGTVMKTICGSRLRARRWELFVRLSCPMQTLVGTSSRRH